MTNSSPSLDAVASAAREAAGDTKISVAVLDQGGHLVSFSRHPEANLATIELAIMKARTSVFFQAPTHALTQVLAPGGVIAGADRIGGGLTGIPGGLPIQKDGRTQGAIGVAGGTPEQDHTIALAALSSLT